MQGLRERSRSVDKGYLNCRNQDSTNKKHNQSYEYEERSISKNKSYSGYRKESRLDKIMKIKVKPSYLKRDRVENTDSKREAMGSYLDD